MTETRITIKGMHCASCETLLTDVISEISGVTSTKLSLKDNSATVVFDDKKTSEKAIRKAIESEGYKTA
jgi:copper chaperone CopZ